MATYAQLSNQTAVLKELYKDDKEFMKDLVYKEHPLFALIPKDESSDGMAGKYIPVPLTYGTPQGRSQTFSAAQNNQTASLNSSFFVYVTQNFQLVTLSNLFMEQTKSDAGAFVDGVKHEMDTAFRNIGNDIAFKMFGDGTGIRSSIGSGVLLSGSTYSITLSNPQDVVNFENGMTLVNATLTLSASGRTILATSALSATTAVISSVNRATGVITVIASATDASWATAGKGLAVQGDLQVGTVSFGATNSMLALCGLRAWIPYDAPVAGDSFWGVDRSVDPTRLGGLRYDASAYTIEEGIVNAIAFANREGARPDMIVMDFASYSAFVNQIGGKVIHSRFEHDEVQVGFDGISFQTAYGLISILADPYCPAQTAYVLTMNTLKLRSLGKAPKILTYGVEGLEGLRVANADALEIRIGAYSQMTCSAPGWNMVVLLSA